MRKQIQETSFKNIFSQEIERSIWKEIFLYIDYKSLRKQLKVNFKKEKVSSGHIEQKLNDIIFCVEQAKEYFDSSKNSTLVTKPVLIYYGLMSLSIALLIFKKKDKVLNSIANSHGLTLQVPDKLKNFKEDQISRQSYLEIGALINENGNFSDFAKLALANRFKINRVNAQGDKIGVDFFKEPICLDNNLGQKKALNLGEILEGMVDIWKEYCLILDKEQKSFRVKISYSEEDKFYFAFDKELQTKEYLDRNPPFLKDFINVGESKDKIFYKSTNSFDQRDFPRIRVDIEGRLFLVESVSLLANDYSLYYLAFFVVGSIARYRPALWKSMLGNHNKGIGTLLSNLNEIAYKKIPLLFLSEVVDSYINTNNDV